jgi:hypothetical protein
MDADKRRLNFCFIFIFFSFIYILFYSTNETRGCEDFFVSAVRAKRVALTKRANAFSRGE